MKWYYTSVRADSIAIIMPIFHHILFYLTLIKSTEEIYKISVQFRIKHWMDYHQRLYSLCLLLVHSSTQTTINKSGIFFIKHFSLTEAYTNSCEISLPLICFCSLRPFWFRFININAAAALWSDAAWFIVVIRFEMLDSLNGQVLVHSHSPRPAPLPYPTRICSNDGEIASLTWIFNCKECR